ncbi:MAG: MMPL family transporter [Candidatus Nanopelagicales bacterium]|nr:MMPL family transporter [Candidatus Nanopelagicales bacterium]
MIDQGPAISAPPPPAPAGPLADPAPLPARPTGILARHGAAMARHARAVALISVLLVVVGYLVAALGVGGPSLFSRLELGEPVVAGEALEGRDLLRGADPQGPSIQADWQDLDPAAPATQAALATVHEELVGLEGVASVVDPTTVGPAAIATSGDGVLVTVVLEADLGDAAQEEATAEVEARLEALPSQVPGSTVLVVSQADLVEAITDQVEADLKKGEGISLPISLLIMVLIFGGFAAAGVPLAGAIASIAGGLVSLLAFTYVIDLDVTVVNVVTVLGLGLCIDYSLLMVSRYREQMHELWDMSDGGHQDVPAEVRQHAMAVTMATAGRTVIFSGVTVAIAVTGLLFIDMTIIQSVGAGAVSVVAIAVLVATSLVPALLVLATRHVAGIGTLARWPGFRRFAGAFDHSPSDEGWFSSWARRVQRRPWMTFLSVAAVLVLLSLPAWRINLVSSGVELLPPDNRQRQAFEQVEASYPLLAPAPVTVVAASSEAAALESLATDVASLPGVERVGPVSVTGEVASVGVFAADEDAADVVREIRQARPPDPQTWVTGPAAILVDFTEQLRSDAPVALLFIVVATLLLLFLLTGSVLIPVKALVMNLLSLGATFGILVLVFQDGRLEDLLGFSSNGGIEATLPVIVFAFAFGLSMDYEVFLLARIKEFHDQGHGNDESVRLGLQRTGRIITSAALLIVVVFAGFVLGDLLAVKQTGVALAVAVAIDATLVRIMLVPATMTLLGEWNWWAPGPLRRLHDRIGVRH